MLGLAEEVGGDDGRVGAVVGDDEELARAGGHVDGGAAGEAGDERLGLGDPGVAGAANLVAAGDCAGAQGQGGDRLGAADRPD